MVGVPNFSEGRDAGVIDAIVSALRVPGARVVYAEADPDHHRLDTTVLGATDAVVASAMAGAVVAVRSIDMFAHHGGHPRMGAADVIPFMPVRGVTMDECVTLARDFGRALAETDAGLPYDRAALSPDRVSWPIRRGVEGCVRPSPGRASPRLRAARRTGGGDPGRPEAARGLQRVSRQYRRARPRETRVRESSGGLPAHAIAFSVPERGGT